MYRLLIFLLVGCGTFQPKPTVPSDKLRELAIKSNRYADLISSHQDSNGFIMTEHCDATLFSGLLSAALPASKIDIRAAANDELDQWYRRPDKDCGPAFGNSRSTISRDMILGILWYMLKNKDVEAAEKLMSQLYNNSWLLKGDGSIGELLVNPSLIGTLANIIKKIGGTSYPEQLLLPASFNKTEGFVAHLTVWHILLRGELFKEIPESHLDILKYHRDRNPRNPLFQAAYHKYTDGNQEVAIDLLLDNNEWPSHSLPTSREHCSDWPIQRDYTEKDWGSCEPVVEHTGAELILIYQLIIK